MRVIQGRCVMTPVKAPVHCESAQMLPVVFLTLQASWSLHSRLCKARVWLVDLSPPALAI